jgi:hypothetical protein
LHLAAPVYRPKLALAIDSYAEIFDKRSNDTSFHTRFYEDLSVCQEITITTKIFDQPNVPTPSSVEKSFIATETITYGSEVDTLIS